MLANQLACRYYFVTTEPTTSRSSVRIWDVYRRSGSLIITKGNTHRCTWSMLVSGGIRSRIGHPTKRSPSKLGFGPGR